MFKRFSGSSACYRVYGGTRKRQLAVELERRLRAEVADHLGEMGLSPTRAKLGLDLARGRDLASEWAEEAGA